MRVNLLFVGILLLAAFFRLYGVNWDQNQHLHPDERFLTMVSGAIKWPYSINQYFDTNHSPLNPHNMGFPFFVYGTFPLFFTKWIAEIVGQGDYNGLTLVGRQLSAFADLGTVILVYCIAKTIFTSTKLGQLEIRSIRNFPLLAMFFYAVMVLPIQLSHFYAVDTYLTFFLTLSFYILIKFINCKLIGNCPASAGSRYWREKLKIGNYAIPLGIAFGLALASKISAVLFTPIIGLVFLISFIKNRKISLFSHCFIVALFIGTFYFTLRLAQPYLFENPNLFDITLSTKVLDNWNQLKSFDDPNSTFPPGIQWITTKPYIFPLKNMIFWGLGFPLGIISVLAVSFSIVTLFHWIIISLKRKSYIIHNSYFIIHLSLLWILLLFLYQGREFVKAMRYFFPIYPFLAILSAYFIYQLANKLRRNFKLLDNWIIGIYWIIGLLVIVYPLSFLSIYSHPHSRIAASKWIYENIPVGSTITSEIWDDGLPLYLPGQNSQQYTGIALPLYDMDTPEKWQKLSLELEKIDYIILSSNRLYGSIMTVPKKYPITTRFYEKLFDGFLGFQKVAEFTSRPNLPIPFLKACLTPPFVRYGIVSLKIQDCPLPGLSFVDDYADESFTVYDHPKVTIFQKLKSVDYLKWK